MRDIPAAEEITYDYAMTDGCDYDVFACRYHSAHCRGRITGTDWKNPTMQTAYEGWFSDYIANLILEHDGLRKATFTPVSRGECATSRL
jgi:uncharacterized protein